MGRPGCCGATTTSHLGPPAAHGKNTPVLSPVLCCLVFTACVATEPEPLAEQGAQAAAIHHALQALTRGDTAPIAALPASTFRAAIGIADPQEAGLVRRWTAFLPQAIARVPVPGRAAVLEALDALFLATSATGTSTPALRACIASDFLPAPTAVATLRAAADRHFDRGELAAFLGCAAQLEQLGADDGSLRARAVAARELSGMPTGHATEPPLLCVPPSVPLAPSAPVAHPAGTGTDGLGVRWHRLGMWLTATDHQDAVRWQRPLDRQAELACGVGGAVVREAGSTRFIAEDGRVVRTAAIPQEARILGVGGGSAWLAMGTRVWRVDFTGGLTVIDVDAEPLGAPLLRGTRTLWLDAWRLTLRSGRQVVTTALHGLPATQGWRLHADTTDGSVAIVGNGRRHGSLDTVEALCAGASTPEQRAFILAAAGQADAARAQLAATPVDDDPARRRQRFRAELALGWDHVAEQWRALAAQAGSPDDQAIVLFAGLPASTADLRRLATGHPLITLPGAGALRNRPLWSPSTWDHHRTGAVWLADDGLTPSRWSTASVQATVIDDGVRRRSDGGLDHRGRSLAITRQDGWLALTARDAASAAPCWFHRWPALTDLSAPSLTLAARNGQIQVMEGDTRLSILAISDGRLLARVAVPPGAAMWSEALVAEPGSVALVGPAGLDRRAWVVRDRDVHHIDLPAAARWLLPMDGRAIVVLADGRVLRLPDLAPCILPAPLTQAPRPTVTANGIQQGDRLYRWSGR